MSALLLNAPKPMSLMTRKSGKTLEVRVEAEAEAIALEHQTVLHLLARGVEGGDAPAPPQIQVEVGVEEEMIDETIEEMIDDAMTETKTGTDAGQSCLEVNDTCKTRDVTKKEESNLRGMRSDGIHVVAEEVEAAAAPPHLREKGPQRKLKKSRSLFCSPKGRCFLRTLVGFTCHLSR